MSQRFYLYNTTRSPHTAGKRRLLPSSERSKRNLILGGGAIHLRKGQRTTVSSALVRQYAGELQKLVSNGQLMVLTSDQRPVDLSTLQAVGKRVPAKVLKEQVEEEVSEPAPAEEPKMEDPTPPAAMADASVEADPPAVEEVAETSPVVEEPVEESVEEQSSPFSSKKKRGKKGR